MKKLTINIEGELNTIIIYNKEKKQCTTLKGEYSFDEFKKLSSILTSDNIIVNFLGIDVHWNSDEMKALTTEELEYICNSLNCTLKDRNNE